MAYFLRSIALTMVVVCWAGSARAREWTDAAGRYTLEAELFAGNDQYAVVRRSDGELGIFATAELSDADRKYLKSEEAAELSRKHLGALQTWTTTSGVELRGRIVDFAQRKVVMQRRRDQTYLNDVRFSNLPALYRQLLPSIVAHEEGLEIPDERALQNWLRSLRNRPRTFELEGVVMEMEDGNEYAIPFFVFPDDDRKLLQGSWAEWRNYLDEFDRQHESAFRLEALAAAQREHQEKMRQIATIDLKLQAINAGLTSAWEVTLYPEPGNPSYPRWVVTLGRNSADATSAALADNPGFFAGPVRRVSSRRP